MCKAGRPSKFKDEYVEQAYKLALLGLTDVEMAGYFGISEQAFNNWKIKYPALIESLKDGRDNADMKVARALYKKATGYKIKKQVVVNYKTSCEVVEIEEEVAPDTTSMIFWLKNRQKKYWRDKQELDLTGDMTFSIIDPFKNNEGNT